jgi:TolB protein
MRFMLSLLCFFTFSVLAQTGDVAVIAVGEAGSEKEKILITPPQFSGAAQKTLSSMGVEFVELLKNDFAFYRHKFDFINSNTQLDGANPDWTAISATGASLLIHSQFESGATGIAKVKVSVLKALDKKRIADFSIDIKNSTLRSEGHRVADGIYRAITQKESIFLSKIVFVTDRTSRDKDTRKELYMMDFDGRRVERLTFYDSTVISPALSPDNSKIMFSLIANHNSGRRGGPIKNIDLKMMDLRTKKVTTISDKPGINSGAIFSADGTKIYFTMSFSGNADIYELELASGKTRRLTTHYSEDVDPSINRDGTLMTFLSNRPGRAHIYIMDPSQAEKDVRRISFVGQFNATPRFSPDGKEIVFTSWVDSGFDLYRIDSFGNNLVRMTKNFGSNEEPSFSPDGEFILFTSQRVISRKKATQDIYLMNREGEIVGQLTTDFGFCVTPRWTN